jgi:hypothetical protein
MFLGSSNVSAIACVAVRPSVAGSVRAESSKELLYRATRDGQWIATAYGIFRDSAGRFWCRKFDFYLLGPTKTYEEIRSEMLKQILPDVNREPLSIGVMLPGISSR